jgi:hypothetical protein
MAKLKPIKDEAELAKIPLDEPVLVELEPAATGAETPLKADAGEGGGGGDDGAQSLQEQLAASQEAAKREREARETAEREARAARAEADELRTSNTDNQKELLTNSLATAQKAQEAAKAKFKQAYESGDPDAMADAQSEIGRAAASVLNYEGAIAQFDDDAKTEKKQTVDIVTAIDRDPNLQPSERTWLKDHPETLTDQRLNRKLAVAYDEALAKGHARGTEGYFKFLDEFMGYAKPAKRDADRDDDTVDDGKGGDVAAPVSRDNRSLGGRPQSTRITLTPTERELARSMNLTDVEYARGKVQLEQNKRADPAKFASR